MKVTAISCTALFVLATSYAVDAYGGVPLGQSDPTMQLKIILGRVRNLKGDVLLAVYGNAKDFKDRSLSQCCEVPVVSSLILCFKQNAKRITRRHKIFYNPIHAGGDEWQR
jgi:hypothetical protein